jgi:hypothetical protein
MSLRGIDVAPIPQRGIDPPEPEKRATGLPTGSGGHPAAARGGLDLVEKFKKKI